MLTESRRSQRSWTGRLAQCPVTTNSTQDSKDNAWPTLHIKLTKCWSSYSSLMMSKGAVRGLGYHVHGVLSLHGREHLQWWKRIPLGTPTIPITVLGHSVLLFPQLLSFGLHGVISIGCECPLSNGVTVILGPERTPSTSNEQWQCHCWSWYEQFYPLPHISIRRTHAIHLLTKL